jgi:hypothetical protein
VARQHDDRRVRRGGAQPLDRLEPHRVGQAEVEQHAVDSAREHLLRLLQPLDAHHLDVRRHAREQRLDEQRIARIVLDEQQLDGEREGHRSGAILSSENRERVGVERRSGR